VGVLTTIQYVYNIFNTPYQIYAMRRYVPIVIPVLMLFGSAAIFAIFRWRRVWLGRIIGSGLAVVWLAGMIYQARVVLPQRDFLSAIEQLTALNSRLKPDAILVMSEPPDATYADIFGVPLRFLFGHAVATIRKDDSSVAPFLESLMAYASEHQRAVQLLALTPVAPVVRDTLQLRPVELSPITLNVLLSSYFDYPATIGIAYYGFEIYDVAGIRHASEVKPAGALDIDVGAMDALFIHAGFHGKELLADALTARWTSGEASIDIPSTGAGRITLEVRAMTFRPHSLPSADVLVWLDGRQIGRFVPTDAWQTFSFQSQPNPAGGTSSLVFTTATFNPSELQINGDDRDLGFLLDWVRVSTLNAESEQ
jgi:hypothetical protein